MFDNEVLFQDSIYLEDLLLRPENPKEGEEVDEFWDAPDPEFSLSLQYEQDFSHIEAEPVSMENLQIFSEDEHREAMLASNESHRNRDILMVRVRGEYILQESRFY